MDFSFLDRWAKKAEAFAIQSKWYALCFVAGVIIGSIS